MRGSWAGRGSAELCGRVGAKPSPRRIAPCAGSMGPCRLARPGVACGAVAARGGREARPAGTWRPVSAAAAGGVTPPAERVCPVPPLESLVTAPPLSLVLGLGYLAMFRFSQSAAFIIRSLVPSYVGGSCCVHVFCVCCLFCALALPCVALATSFAVLLTNLGCYNS